MTSLHIKCSNPMVLLILFLVFISLNSASLKSYAEEKKYDVELGSRIHGSGEQPKMIFILPWRSQVTQRLPLKNNVDGYFDSLLEPKSKNDLEYEYQLMLKQLKKPE